VLLVRSRNSGKETKMRNLVIFRNGNWLNTEDTLADAKGCIMADIHDREVCGQAPARYMVKYKGRVVWSKAADKMTPAQRLAS
jgi:hypothetical protein